MTSADAALVAERSRTGCLCRILECRLEIPGVAARIERQAHHAPELPGSRLEILCVEVWVAGRIGRGFTWGPGIPLWTVVRKRVCQRRGANPVQY